MKKLVYLACPYSDEDPITMEMRFVIANRAAGELMQKGYYVFSPISHTHPIAKTCSLPTGWEYWQGFDRVYLECCKKLFVLCIPGWRKSVGVAAEIAIAKELGLPIEYMDWGG